MLIDDERSSRAELRRMIEAFSDVQLVGEAANADQAEVMIKIQKPDLLFLDIQMPERSGFDLLESLDEIPYIIFTTAFDRHAVKAFEVNALDYLLKPIRAERLALAIEKVRTKLTSKHPPDRIFIKDKDNYHFISWEKIYLIESMDNYARLFFEDKNVWFKSSLNRLEERLDKLQFFRCNRSQMINLNFILKIKIIPSSKLLITLKTGQTVALSERRSVHFRAINKI
ncbi:response regulator transcription factor [Pedobacter aquatilis]|uniref:LytR/AlgR family response regulator transcription factor n=1 Tax=Pedobacter aquatilis TaxID=351343 RepID=UPI00292F17B8|nr:response regulator transcription factor [Pedobacter aquatilis]